MTDYESVLAAAQKLSPPDRLRLIDELWEDVPSDVDAPFSEEWIREIERRITELDSGAAQTVPWPRVRDEALARTRNAKAD